MTYYFWLGKDAEGIHDEEEASAAAVREAFARWDRAKEYMEKYSGDFG